MSKCAVEEQYLPCCKQKFDFVRDANVLSADQCQMLESQFGYSLALSADGQILVVGARTLTVDGVANYGAVFVYGRQKPLGVSVKTPEYRLLQRLDADPGNVALMGNTVAISGDAQRIAVSAVLRSYPENDPQPTSGAVLIFDRDCKNGRNYYTLVQRVFAQTFSGEEIVFDNIGASTCCFGQSMVLSFNGRVLIATVSNTNAPNGKVYIYEDKTCKQLRTHCCVQPASSTLFVLRQNIDKSKMVSDSGISTPTVADSVAIDNDGSTLVIGCKAAGPPFFSGAALVYKRANTADVWVFSQTLSTGIVGSQFGVSVDITADGSRIVVESSGGLISAPSGSGVVYYRPSIDSLYSVESVLPSAAPDFNFANAFSSQCAISDNGCIVAIGYEGTACSSGNNCGDVVIYERKCLVAGDASTSQWAARQRLFEPVSRPEHRFGFSVALDSKGLTLAVSSPAPQPTAGFGQVYTYRAPTVC